MAVTDTLLANNQAYARGFDKGDLPMPPAKQVAVVACMDARLVVSDDVIRSLVISQRLLATTEIILIHHSDCGMLTFKDDEVKAQIAADTGTRPAFALEAFPDCAEDVKQSIARLRNSPFLKYKEAIRGFVFDVKTGLLEEVEALAPAGGR
jgi:carbonic anhydrase